MDQQPTFTRREFVHTGLGLIGLSATVPAFLSDTALAMTQAAAGRAGAKAGPDDPALVVIHLAGGNDGLNTIAPYENDVYYRARPSLAVKKGEVLRLANDLGLHPSAVGLKSLWDDGCLSIIQGVGYPNPNRSHFVGTRIWQTASPEGREHLGWLGRYFDNECKGTDAPDPRLAIALDDELPLALQGERFSPICVKDPSNFKYLAAGKAPRLIDRDGDGDTQDELERNDGALSFLRRSMLDTAVSADDIRAAARRDIPGAKFPRSLFGRSLQSVARMLAGGLSTRVYYISHGGFDTHANQQNRHANLMQQTGEGLRAFVDALKKTGQLQRTLVMVFSEFGRRVEENASGGTDHGEAAPMFLIGHDSIIKPGFHGDMPSLDKLHRGDLAWHTDFRQVYATVLHEYMKANDRKILKNRFKTLPLLKA